jgi:hypothetical protein
MRCAVLFLPQIMTVLTSRVTRVLLNFPSLEMDRFDACRRRDMKSLKR